jgi:hypothetical protein
VTSVSGYRIAPPLSTPSSRLPRFSIAARGFGVAGLSKQHRILAQDRDVGNRFRICELQTGAAAHYVTHSGLNEAMSLTLPHVTRVYAPTRVQVRIA